MIDDLGVSEQGWASYSFSTHLFSPRAGRILVFRTHDNKYAKMEIIYFYDSLHPDTGGGDPAKISISVASNTNPVVSLIKVGM